MNKPNKIIITGASGQIGFYLREYLLKNTDHMIYAISKFGDEIIPSSARLKMLYGDVRYPACIEEHVKQIQPDYFINLAAIPKNNLCERAPSAAFDTNVDAVYCALASIKKYAPNCRFFNAGSVYELTKSDLYSTTKKAARKIVEHFRNEGLYATQPYLGHAESERRTDNYVCRKITKGVARIKNALNHSLPFQPIEVGNLEEKLDISDSRDIAAGIWACLNQEIYNKDYILSSGKFHKIREIVEIAFETAEVEAGWWINVQNDPLTERFIRTERGMPIPDDVLVQTNSGFYQNYIEPIVPENIELAQKELGWTPKITFQEIIRRMTIADLKNS